MIKDNQKLKWLFGIKIGSSNLRLAAGPPLGSAHKVAPQERRIGFLCMISHRRNPSLSPLASYVRSRLLARLQSLRPGEVIPGEVEFATECAVSRTTLRKVLDAMSRDGLIRVEGNGRILLKKIRASDVPEATDEPLPRQRQVVRHILDQIGRGQISPGDRLNEKKIAAELGFSTGPVREGLLLLAPLGLIRKRVRRQWEATSVEPKQWAYLMELRKLVEV